MRYGSVCSGIEAAACAWHPLGWEAAWFAEIEPFPSAVLAHRWPGVLNLGDFTAIGAEHGPVDLLVGGTPCQSFSVAGLRGGLADDRGNLALEFLRLAARVRARWVVWENVPGVFSSTSHQAPDPRPPPPPVDMGLDGQEVETEDDYRAEELHAFNCFLAGLSELGYGCAYRTLDAQFFGVPQRRRRVFVVGYLGDWRAAAAVLFERASLRGDPPPSRKAREEVAGTLGGGSGSRGWADDLDRAGAFIAADLAPTLNAHFGDKQGLENQHIDGGRGLFVAQVAHSLRADGFDASEDGTGRGTPLVVEPQTFDWQAGGGGNDTSFRGKSRSYTVDKPGRSRALTANKVLAVALRGREGGATAEVGEDRAHALRASSGGGDKPHVLAFSAKDHGADAGAQAPTLRAGGHTKSHANGGVMPAVAFDARQNDVLQYGEKTGPLDTAGHSMAVAFHENQRAELTVSDTAGAPKNGGGKPGQGYPATLHHASVRRLTPRECERLQGFPDSYTDVPFRGKPASDGPRYKALGNSMAVPCMNWLGRRIQAVEDILKKSGARHGEGEK